MLVMVESFNKYRLIRRDRQGQRFIHAHIHAHAHAHRHVHTHACAVIYTIMHTMWKIKSNLKIVLKATLPGITFLDALRGHSPFETNFSKK